MAKKTENKQDVIQQTKDKMIALFGKREVYDIYKIELIKTIKQTQRNNYFSVRCTQDKNKIKDIDIIIIQDLYSILNIDSTSPIKQNYIDNIIYAKKQYENNLK